MDNKLDIVHKLPKDNLFPGLSYSTIQYLRHDGLWMPVTSEILEVDADISQTDCQIYVDPANGKDYLTFIIEQGEFLTGAVYGHIDNSAISPKGYLHQYAMEDGDMVFEAVQAIHEKIVFLELVDAYGNILIGWEDEEIEGIIKLTKGEDR